MIYLYAFCDHPELPLPCLPGQKRDNTDILYLQREVYQDLTAIYSYTPVSTLPPDSENIWRHETVIEALMVERTVLPARFGTILESEASLRAKLTSLYPDLLANIERLSGCIEVSLQVLWKPPEDKSSGMKRNETRHTPTGKLQESGIEYMQARLQEELQVHAVRQKAEILATALHATLQSLAKEDHYQVTPTPGLLFKAAYLIERDQLDVFQQEVQNLTATHKLSDEQKFLCTGPWPPYSFIRGLMPNPEHTD